jgi:hypothetical protein
MKRSVLFILLIAAGIIIAMSLFFAKTVSMAKPTSMKLFLPKKEKDTATLDTGRNAVTLLLFNDNELYAYRGTDYSNGKTYTTTSSLRDYLIAIKKEAHDSSFVVIIKPLASATYKNTVNALDEMTINNISRYAMIDPNEQDQKIIESLRKGQL